MRQPLVARLVRLVPFHGGADIRLKGGQLREILIEEALELSGVMGIWKVHLLPLRAEFLVDGRGDVIQGRSLILNDVLDGRLKFFGWLLRLERGLV